MAAPVRTADNPDEWSVRAGQRRRPPDDPPKKEARQFGTDGLSQAIVQAQDVSQITGTYAVIKRIQALRAEIRCGDASERIYIEHNKLIEQLRPPMPRRQEPLSVEQRLARERAQNFAPSLKFGPSAQGEQRNGLEETPFFKRIAFSKTRSYAAADLYQAVRSQPMLKPGEDIELARRWRDAGDQGALDRLTSSHMRLIDKHARNVTSAHTDIDDIHSAGYLALTLAARCFDPDVGASFSSYATRAVVWAMRRAAKPTRDVLNGALPLDKPIGEDGTTHVDVLAAPSEPEDAYEEARIDLEQIIPTLDPRERQIIQHRHLGDKTVPLAEVGKPLNLSYERIRQIESLAFEKIRRQRDEHSRQKFEAEL